VFAVAALLIFSSFPTSHLIAKGHHSVEGLPLSGRAPIAASMGLAASQSHPLAPGFLAPNYDEQIGTTFTQDFTSLAYNVTAVAQTDTNGYGPGYLLNGVTGADYWYQVGISFHWPLSEGTYFPTFGFAYEVFSSSGKTVFPTNGGAGLDDFSGPVHSGDSVLLSLSFAGGDVVMLAKDWNTGATANATYTSNGSTSFVGEKTEGGNSQGFFTGLMTEWYHVDQYSGNEQQVTYSSRTVTLSSAWMWIDEFNSQTPSSPLFVDETPNPVTLTSNTLVPFSAGGATSYLSAHQFITGQFSANSSTEVNLVPATDKTTFPNFTASYTSAGQQRNLTISGGTSVVQADPGTSVTISINQGSNPLEKWVFNDKSATQVSFQAGTNATYAFYELVQESLTYQVANAGSGQQGPSPVLTYEQPPPTISAQVSLVQATQPIGTSPVEIFAVVGAQASVNGTLSEGQGSRLATSEQNFTVTAPNSIPSPIQFYHQVQVSVGYSVQGGGTPSQSPEFSSTSFGSPLSVQVSRFAPSPVWVDYGSSFAFTNPLNGSSSTERWSAAAPDQSRPSAITSPENLNETYSHQYYVILGVNVPSAGTTSKQSGWFNAGSDLNATATPSQGWKFEQWTGSGDGAYTGPSQSIAVRVSSPLTENATFYVQLAIAADAGESISYKTNSETGTVQPGTTKTLYLPPAARVTLNATPSAFVYTFNSWQGAALPNSTRPSVGLVVNSPTRVTGTSTFSYVGAVAVLAAAITIVLVASLFIRGRRRSRLHTYEYSPG
jgi:hypothetical protein